MINLDSISAFLDFVKYKNKAILGAILCVGEFHFRNPQFRKNQDIRQ